MRYNTALADDNISEQLVQPRLIISNQPLTKRAHALFVVTDGELQVTGHDTLLLVITSGITSKLEDFGGKVFEDCGKVD